MQHAITNTARLNAWGQSLLNRLRSVSRRRRKRLASKQRRQRLRREDRASYD